MFIFYYSSEFSEDFADNLQLLLECLKYPEKQTEGECPLGIVRRYKGIAIKVTGGVMCFEGW